MKNLVTILCHCNTPPKLNVLEKNIHILKSTLVSESPGLDVLLSSHISVPPYLQEQVDYVIFDKSNPVTFFPERGSLAWWEPEHLMENENGIPIAIRLEAIFPDYEWAALNQIINSGNFGLSLDYDYYSFINYDLKVTPEAQGHLANPQGVTVSTNTKSQDDLSRMSLLLNILDRKTLKKLLPLFKREEYVKRVEGADMLLYNGIEAYWDQLLRDTTSEYTVIPTPLEDEVNFELGLHYSNNFNQNQQNDFLKIFLDNTDQPQAYIYDIKPSEGISFKINDKIFHITRPQLLPLPQHIEQIGFFHPTHQS
ncbi:MAG TPA: hypothetical protein EYO58_01260, partial [Flavobacteriales bacterium]|nr:hypothetical protein [Flavobacteriales bacterium]